MLNKKAIIKPLRNEEFAACQICLEPASYVVCISYEEIAYFCKDCENTVKGMVAEHNRLYGVG